MHIDSMKQVTGFCFETICKGLLSLLLLVLLIGIGFGVARTAVDLFAAGVDLMHGAHLHEAMKELVINVLMVLAVVEMFRTVKAYFSEGRVKVTYIIDTVLVVIITEIMGFWYREVEPEQMTMAIILVFSLMAVRILAIRFSPKRKELFEGL